MMAILETPTAPDQKLLWAPLYEAVLDILGTTGVIIPMGDTNHEASNRTTVTTVGEEAAVFTYSEAVTSFATPPYFKGPGRIPVITFNGTDEEADTPDAAYWTRGDDSNDSPFSIGAWVNVVDTAANRTMFSKWDDTNRQEWIFEVKGNDALRVLLADENAGVNAARESDSALTMAAWRFVVMTYDGTGGATAANGITLYDNGPVMASTATNNGAYVAMEIKTGLPAIGKVSDGDQSFFRGLVAGGPLAPFFTQIELTADAILRLYQLARAALDV